MKARVTYGNVMATLALFIALGGVAYAAVKLAPNAVRSKHIKNGQVKSADLRDGGVAKADIEPGLLDGAVGPAGPEGPQGETGPAGPPGSAVVDTTVTNETVTAGANPGAYGGAQTISWSQPPGTVDEIRGVIRLNYPAQCTDAGEGVGLLAYNENNREISTEIPLDTKPNANGPVVAGEPIRGAEFPITETIDAASSDIIPLPIEDYIWENAGSSPAQRQVRISAARIGAGCTASPTASLARVYVIRSAL